MKVLKERSREYNGKSYYKYKVNIPEEKLNQAEFKEGDDLEVEAKKGELKLSKKKVR